MRVTNNTELWQRGYSCWNHKSSIQVRGARSCASHYDVIGGFRIVKLGKKQ